MLDYAKDQETIDDGNDPDHDDEGLNHRRRIIRVEQARSVFRIRCYVRRSNSLALLVVDDFGDFEDLATKQDLGRRIRFDIELVRVGRQWYRARRARRDRLELLKERRFVSGVVVRVVVDFTHQQHRRHKAKNHGDRIGLEFAKTQPLRLRLADSLRSHGGDRADPNRAPNAISSKRSETKERNTCKDRREDGHDRKQQSRAHPRIGLVRIFALGRHHAIASASARPVWDRLHRAISSGEPVATISPPAAPPSGPRSMTWSA